MDGIRATPYINPLLGSVNELVGGLLGYMRDPRRTQQLQGLAGLLESTGVPKTLERLAYGEPLTNIQRANVPVLRPETAEALLTLSPVPQATSRAAMAAGRAGERMAERVVPQVMERGGMPAGLLESMSSRTVSPLTVYHGSPHKFEKFDASKIGTGEGAQSYGYGHYVAESPKVADEYRVMLSTHKVTGEAAQDLANYSLRMKPTIEEAIKYLQKEKKTAINQSKASSNEFATDEYVKQYDDAIALLRSNKGEKAGNLYTIDLPDSAIARMLDWDKPLSEQPTEVKNFLSKVSFNPPRKDQPIGEWLKPRLSEGMSPYWSEDLRKAGIPGIRYLDQGSRGAGEGTSNFVVFPGNEGLLTIQKRNNEVIAPTSLLDYRIQHRPMTVEGGASKLHEAMGTVSNVMPQKTQSIVREGNPIQSAVVLIGDKIFTGRTHTDAFNRAIYEGVVRKEGGKFIYPKDAEINSDLFMTKDGQIIDRIQASRMFDIGASETAIEEGLMQNKPAGSMSIDSYIEQAEAIKKQRQRNSGLLD